MDLHYYINFLISGSNTSAVYAEITVNFVAPPLLDEMAGLEPLLLANIGSAVSNIREMAAEMLIKPDLTASCGKASGISGLLSTLRLPGGNRGVPYKNRCPRRGYHRYL